MLLTSLFYLTIFIFGLTIGSFLNCIIYRLKVDKSFLEGRSYCPKCKHILMWKDLIPIFSFLILKGKCRYCSKKISWQYPLVEFFTATLFVLIANQQLTISPLFTHSNQQLTVLPIINFCFLFLISCFLIIIFVYDLKHYLIPDKIIYPAIATAFLYNIFYSFFILDTLYFILHTLFAALGAAAFFLLIVFLSKGKWMGVGDIKLAFFMGLFLGFPNILIALFLAFLIGAIIGLGLIALGKKSLKSEVPFGPFLVVGTFIVLFWGEKLLKWYFSLF